MVYIYILQLEDNKYYIGKTENPEFRLNSHFDSYGSAWTKKYKPIKVLKLISNCSNFDEDKYTKEYMKKKGINNVRGGSYCKIKLDNDEINSIQKEINGATNCCYICGSNEHFASNCNNSIIDNLTTKFNLLSTKNFISAKKFEGEKFGYLFKHGDKGLGYYKDIDISLKKNSNEGRCFKCHRVGHYQNDCYAKKDIYGNFIDDEDETEDETEDEELVEMFACSYCDRLFETQNGANYHQRFYCKKKCDTRNNRRNYNRCYYN